MHDLIGIGFGPSNLALAIALKEHPRRPAHPKFFEKSPTFSWHAGMLFEDATMQVSFLKDLVTLRDPRSEHSFLCYLQSRGRLVDFINRKDFFPSRLEFHDYLRWAAASFDDVVEYGHRVRSVMPVRSDGEVVALDVETVDADGRTERHRTRNLVVGSGLRPRLPSGITASPCVWHSSELLHRLDAASGPDPKSIVVVGAGQSAAEVAAHLHSRFTQAKVHAILPRYGYSVSDDSPFANRVFDPSAVDEFFHAPTPVKEKFYEYHGNTNYAVVDAPLIDELYRRAYTESIRGEARLNVWKMTEVSALEEEGDSVRLKLTSLYDGCVTDLDADIIVFATGYEPVDPATVLGPAAGLCERDRAGRVRVRRDYRIETVPGVSASIYLQGGTEHTHGISASLLSNSAVRAWDIVESLVEHA